MKSICLLLSRFFLSAWVGAAALFVTTSVREVTSGISQLRDSTIRNALVQVRFPSYYLFGFSLVGAAFVCSLLAWKHTTIISKLRLSVSILLMFAALGVMSYDYFQVYLPLEKMVTPAEKAKPAEFVETHEQSKMLNYVDVSLCFVAAILLCYPTRIKKQPA